MWIIGSIIALILLLIFLIRLPSVQNYVVGKVSNYLENKLGTQVDIGHIYINFPKKLELNDVFFADESKDTLIAGESLMVDINMFKLLKNTVEINELQLKGITAKINRKLPDSTFNFDYIVAAFSSEKESTPTADSSSALTFDIDKVLFERIKFVYKDDVIGTSADIYLNKFDTRVSKFDLTNNMAFGMPNVKIDGLSADIKQWAVISSQDSIKASDFGITDQSVEQSSLLPSIDIKTVDLKNIFIRYDDKAINMQSKFDIKNLAGNIDQIDLNKEIVKLKEIKLSQSDSEVLFGKTTTEHTFDDKADTTTSSVNWKVSVDKLAIEKTNFWFKDDNEARTKGIDYFNLKLTDIAGALDGLYYSSDSISGDLKGFTVKDHSGFDLKMLKGDFVYTNTGATIKDLLLETPNTLIQDEIVTSYPSLDAVSNNPATMSINANIKKSHIDMKDIRLLAPDLEKEEVMKPLMNKRFYIDGKVMGKLNDLRIPRFEFKTLNNTHVIATAHIKGLPDVDKMYLDLNLKKLVTGRNDLNQLIAPSLLPDSIQ